MVPISKTSSVQLVMVVVQTGLCLTLTEPVTPVFLWIFFSEAKVLGINIHVFVKGMDFNLDLVLAMR